jgi:predicted transport protein
MSDIKIFRLTTNLALELKGQSVALEKSLQTVIENNLFTFLGVRFLASEYSTGRTHGGRIDTLGLDENHRPVIIEYKRSVNENVINQGLYYLDWLMDHKAEFVLLVVRQLGQSEADAIEWSSPRLLCIAGDFTKYDEHAVQQINRNIELIRYRKFENNLLLFELVNATLAQDTPGTSRNRGLRHSQTQAKTVSENLELAKQDLRDLFEEVRAFLLALGDDVQMNTLKFYFAFKRIKNFACIEIYPRVRKIIVYTKVDPDTIDLREGFTRDVRNVGHVGTGDLQITISSNGDFENAKPLLLRGYEAS